MRVLALVTLPTLGAGNRLRIEQYAPLLRREGIDIEVSPFFDDAAYRVLYRRGHTASKVAGVTRGLARRARDLVRAHRYDLLIVYREALPLGPPVFEGLMARLGVRYVLDFDDALFLRPIHPVNQRWAWLRHPSRVGETARRAVAVITNNEYVASWARRWNADVTVIPTPVDTERHRPRAPRREGDGPVVLGWIGSSTTAPYLHLLDEPLARLAERREFVVRVIGGEYGHREVPVQHRPYRLESEPADVATFDIGLLPEPDDEWTKGKGAFKALVYMATGLPVVASRVGVNPEVVVHGETGFCVASATEWVDALDRLIQDGELRGSFGRRGRERVERLYSLRVHAPRLAAVLRRSADRA